MSKILIHLVKDPRCGRCGRVMGEDVDSSNLQREKAKADSVFRPTYFCRSEGCSQRGKRVTLEPTELDEVAPAITKQIA